jgi:hypothetical protein
MGCRERRPKDCPELLLKGAAGLAKAALGIDRASDEIVAQRRNQCRECPHATKNPKRVHLPTKGLTKLSRCQLCDCFIHAKTLLASETCPDGRWLETANALTDRAENPEHDDHEDKQ